MGKPSRPISARELEDPEPQIQIPLALVRGTAASCLVLFVGATAWLGTAERLTA